MTGVSLEHAGWSLELDGIELESARAINLGVRFRPQQNKTTSGGK